MKGICCGTIILFSLSIGLYESKGLQQASEQRHSTHVSRKSHKGWTGREEYSKQLKEAKSQISYPFVDSQSQQQIISQYKVQARKSIAKRLVFQEVGNGQVKSQSEKIDLSNLRSWINNNRDPRGNGVYKWRKVVEKGQEPSGKSIVPVGKLQKVKSAVPKIEIKFGRGGKKPSHSSHMHQKVDSPGKVEVKSKVNSVKGEANPPHTRDTVSIVELTGLTSQLDQIRQVEQINHKRKLCKRRAKLCKSSGSQEDHFASQNPPSPQNDSNENQQQQNQMNHNGVPTTDPTTVLKTVPRTVPEVLELVQQSQKSPADNYELTPFVRQVMTPTPSTPLWSPEAGDYPTSHSHRGTQPVDHSQKANVTVQQLLNRRTKKRNQQETLVFTFSAQEIQAHQIASLEVVPLNISKSISRSKSKSRSRSKSRSHYQKHSQKGKSSKPISVVEAKLKAIEQNSKYGKNRVKEHRVDKPYRTNDISHWKPYDIKTSKQQEIVHNHQHQKPKEQAPSKIKDLVNYYEGLSKVGAKGGRIRRKQSLRRESFKRRLHKSPVKQGETQKPGFIHQGLQSVNEQLQKDVFEK